jgi:ATP-binding cassette subfamily G (WHITE) protein 2 (SNQ2)
MGWYRNPRQTTPDFLTSCTSVNERKISDGFDGIVPQTPESMARYFRESVYWSKVRLFLSRFLCGAHH